MTSQRLTTSPHYTTRVGRYAAGERFGPRSLRSFELVWVLSGAAEWTVERTDAVATRTASLAPGTIALAQAGIVDSYRWDSHVPSSHAYVHFDLRPAPDAATMADWPLVRPMHEPLAGLCSYLLTLSQLGDATALARTREVVDLLVDVFLHGPFLAADATPIRSAHLVQAAEHVRETWARDGVRLMSVAELAAAAQVSVGHLSREFRAEFGLGPAAALELVRLGQAAIALQRTNQTLERVAQAHGFSSPYHFSRRFSAAYGLPPGGFRRTEQERDPLWPLTEPVMSLWHAVVA